MIAEAATPREILLRLAEEPQTAELVVALIGNAIQTAQCAHDLEARVRAENDLLYVALEVGRRLRVTVGKEH